MRRVAPQALELVEVARLGVEDMNDDVVEVHQNPPAQRVAFGVVNAAILFVNGFLHAVRDSPKVSFGFAGAAAIMSTVIWLTNRKKGEKENATSNVRVLPTTGRHEAGVSAAFSF